ncbi:hypothetical protein niasHT_015866 [Heterodera trifolii]|uniref:MADF domain-containing protein n=1 Tax=Heterodera trifolii TaxID=157864 RepID=A0ABD2LE82_9BILA
MWRGGRAAGQSIAFFCGEGRPRPPSVRRCRVAPPPSPIRRRPSPARPTKHSFISSTRRGKATRPPADAPPPILVLCFLLLGESGGEAREGPSARPTASSSSVVLPTIGNSSRTPTERHPPPPTHPQLMEAKLLIGQKLMKRRFINEKIVKKGKLVEEIDDGMTMEEEEPFEKVPKMEEAPEEKEEEKVTNEEKEEEEREEEEEEEGAAENGAENGRSEANELDSAFPAMISNLFGTHPLRTAIKKKRPSQRRGNAEEETFHSTNDCHGKFDAKDTRNFNSSLVEEVSRHPALFDFTRDEYKSTEARNRHWAEVAEEMQQSVEFVRTRWKTLRDRFKKEVRRQHQCVEGPIWQHYDKMLYLLPFIRDKDDSTEVGTTVSNGSVGIRSKNGARRAEGPTDNGTDRGTTLWHGEREQKRRTNNGNLLHPPPINSCTAAILDLAMSAVTKLSPPPTDEMPSSDGRQCAISEGLPGQEASSSSSDMVGSSSSASSASSLGGGSGTAIVTTSLLRPFPCASLTHAHHQRTHLAKEPKRNAEESEGGAGGTAETKWQQDDRDEDELFCKIVYRKLCRIGDERLKEYAKARIIDLLVDVQYGGGAGTADGAYQ